MTDVHPTFALADSVPRRVLHHLAVAGVPVPLTYLHARLPQVLHSHIYNTARKLEDRGLAERHNIPDERASRWSVTPAGRDFLRSRDAYPEGVE